MEIVELIVLLIVVIVIVIIMNIHIFQVKAAFEELRLGMRVLAQERRGYKRRCLLDPAVRRCQAIEGVPSFCLRHV